MNFYHYEYVILNLLNKLGLYKIDNFRPSVKTSTFDAKAVAKAETAHHKIVLIDGEQLVDLMHKYDVGVQTKTIYKVKQIDEDFFMD